MDLATCCNAFRDRFATFDDLELEQKYLEQQHKKLTRTLRSVGVCMTAYMLFAFSQLVGSGPIAQSSWFFRCAEAMTVVLCFLSSLPVPRRASIMGTVVSLWLTFFFALTSTRVNVILGSPRPARDSCEFRYDLFDEGVAVCCVMGTMSVIGTFSGLSLRAITGLVLYAPLVWLAQNVLIYSQLSLPNIAHVYVILQVVCIMIWASVSGHECIARREFALCSTLGKNVSDLGKERSAFVGLWADVSLPVMIVSCKSKIVFSNDAMNELASLCCPIGSALDEIAFVHENHRSVLFGAINAAVSSGHSATRKTLLQLANVAWVQADILPCWSAKHGWEAVLVASDFTELVGKFEDFLHPRDGQVEASPSHHSSESSTSDQERVMGVSLPQPQASLSSAANTAAFATDRHSVLQKIEHVGRSEQWLIPNEIIKVDPCQNLGEGGFGSVLKGILYDCAVAVKLAKPVNDADIPEANVMSALTNELRILRRLRHPNIVLFYGACVAADVGKLAIVLELVEGENFWDFVLRHQEPTFETIIRRVVFDVSSALAHIHAQTPCIVHGDMKPTNIMVENKHGNHQGKLLDFGLSRLVRGYSKAISGTKRWVAPEVVFSDCMPDISVDVFSLGCVVYFAASRKVPSVAGINKEKWSELVKRNVVMPFRWPNTAFAESLQHVANNCLNCNPALRVTMQQLHRTMGQQWEAFLRSQKDVVFVVWNQLDTSGVAPGNLASFGHIQKFKL
eukprot:TRINITY_DN9472_c0_g1_i1.p1 TRINITY_DN9472_c0_g1~~TRINITY_DN9472_c0_g1_i1.p1  ORF type:complete len:736 (-),score=91.72 TRINITY_DN9472_c0_g1_i1:122-2329(-)